MCGFLAAIGGYQQPFFGTNGTTSIRSELKPLTAWFLTTLLAFNTGDEAQAELTVVMVTLELRLDLVMGIVENEMVAAPCSAVTTALVSEFSAAYAH